MIDTRWEKLIDMVDITDGWLLDFYDKHKDGVVFIKHNPLSKESTGVITLGQLFTMFELVRERDANSVRQD